MIEDTARWLEPMMEAAKDDLAADEFKDLMFQAVNWMRLGQLLRDRLGWNWYPDDPARAVRQLTPSKRTERDGVGQGDIGGTLGPIHPRSNQTGRHESGLGSIGGSDMVVRSN